MDLKEMRFAPCNSFVVEPGKNEPGRKDKGKAGGKNKRPAFYYVPFLNGICKTSHVGPLMLLDFQSCLSWDTGKERKGAEL